MNLDSKLIKKEPVSITKNKVEGVMNYGDSNLYPQENRRLVMQSTTGTGCVQIYSDHIGGQGFGDWEVSREEGSEGRIFSELNVELNRTKLNWQGLTVGKLLKKAAKDFALFGGYALHINWNMNFEISSINWIPFEQVRLTSPDMFGISTHAVLCSNWEQRNGTTLEEMIFNSQQEKPSAWKINLWNPSPDVIQSQVDLAGGWSNYHGQVYYFNPSDAVYPFPVYESSRLDMAVEAKATSFKYHNIHRGFLAGHIVNYHGALESEDQKDALVQHFKEYQGEENTAALIMMFTEGILPEGQNSPLNIQKLERNVDDKLFQFSSESSADSILRSFKGMPPALIGIDRAQSFITGRSGESFKNSQAIFNARTQSEREQLAEAFWEVLQYFPKDLGGSDAFNIIPIQMQF